MRNATRCMRTTGARCGGAGRDRTPRLRKAQRGLQKVFDLVCTPPSVPGMDDFGTAPPSTMPDLNTAPTRGRPTQTPAQREMSDQRYAQMKDLYDSMPSGAREPKFSVFLARRRHDAKRDPRALEKIQLGSWKEQGLSDEGALVAYLEHKHGPDRYLIEPQDEHNQRITKFPSWCVSTSDFDEDDMDDDFDDEDDRTRRTRRTRRDDDLKDDDPDDRRSNIADSLVMASRASAAGQTAAMSNQKDMMSLMIMTSQQNQDRQRDDERLRREEERRTESRREDERRREDTKREEDRLRREDDRRREDAKAIEDRRMVEERRTDERRADDRRIEQIRADAKESSDKRFQAMLALFPTILPVLERVLKPAPPREADATQLMITKAFLEKSTSQSPHDAISVIIEATKAGQMLQAEQMRNAMSMQGELNKVLLTKALEMVENGSGGGEGDGGTTIDKVMKIVTGAAELAQKFIPAAPSPYEQEAMQRLQRIQRPALVAPVPAPVPVAPAEPVAAAPAASATPEVSQAELEKLNADLEARVSRDPAYGVMRGLYALQQRHYGDSAEHQRLVEYSVSLMPLPLRVAILDGDEQRVISACMPTVQSDPMLSAWITSAGALDWVRDFVPKLKPAIVHVFGAADVQRDQLVNEIAAARLAQEPGDASPPEPELVPEQVLVPDPAPTTAAVLQGPGAIEPSAPVVAEGDSPKPSHLDV